MSRPGLETLGFPPAWMGFADITPGKVVVRVCAWCPSKAKCDEMAAAAGFAVTHSMCAACAAVQFAGILNFSL